jgi:phospholipid-binding lipoprotein MlaA
MKKSMWILMLLLMPMVCCAEGLTFDESDFDFDFDEEDEVALNVPDPLEGINRPLFAFNHWILKAVRPVVRVYRRVPEAKRQGAKNFFENLSSPLSLVNDVLQGKFSQATQRTGDFIVNSIVGLGGIYNIRSKVKTTEDFGQTLGHYGIKPGPYLQLPFLGPNALRDTLTLPFNWMLDGDNFLFPKSFTGSLATSLTETMGRLDDIEAQSSHLKDALDPYLMVRDAYWQIRETQVQQ